MEKKFLKMVTLSDWIPKIKKLEEFDLFKRYKRVQGRRGNGTFLKTQKNTKPKQVWLDMYDIRNSVIDVNAKVNVKCAEYMKKKPWASALDLKDFRKEAFKYYGNQNGLSDDMVQHILRMNRLDDGGVQFSAAVKKAVQKKYMDHNSNDRIKRSVEKELRT